MQKKRPVHDKKIYFNSSNYSISKCCSVKNEDSTAEKVAKHTVNSPLYIILGTGMLVETAVRGTLIGGAKAMGAKDKRDEKTTEEVKPSVPQESENPISQ